MIMDNDLVERIKNTMLLKKEAIGDFFYEIKWCETIDWVTIWFLKKYDSDDAETPIYSTRNFYVEKNRLFEYSFSGERSEYNLI